jgi:hypothetical protein
MTNHKFTIGVLVFIGTAFGLAYLLADHFPVYRDAPEPTFKTALVCFNGPTPVYQGEVDLFHMGVYTHFTEIETGAEFRTSLPCFAIEPTTAFLAKAQKRAKEQEQAHAPPPPASD